MKRSRILTVLLLVAIFAFVPGTNAFAADGDCTVEYQLYAFQTVTKTVASGEQAPVLTVADFHKGISGSLAGESQLATDGLLTKWYTDEARTQEYSFDTAVHGNLKLYGDVTEIQTYGESDVYGWNAVVDRLYVGSPILNRAVTGDNITFPQEFDPESGRAEFEFAAGAYSVFYRPLDATKSFTVTLDITPVVDNIGVTMIDISIFDKLTLAQAATVYGHENGGALSYTLFWADAENYGKVQNAGYYSGEPTPRTIWVGTSASDGLPICNQLRSYLADHSTIPFEFRIGETASEIYIEGVKYADLGCKLSDFDNGQVYISVGAPLGASSMGVSVYQQPGKATVTTDGKGITATDVKANCGYLTASVTVPKNTLLKAKIGDVDVRVQDIGNGKYAVEVPGSVTKDYTVTFYTEKSGGCGTIAYTPVVLLGLIAAALVVVKKAKAKI